MVEKCKHLSQDSKTRKTRAFLFKLRSRNLKRKSVRPVAGRANSTNTTYSTVLLYVMCICIQDTDCPVINFFCNRVN